MTKEEALRKNKEAFERGDMDRERFEAAQRGVNLFWDILESTKGQLKPAEIVNIIGNWLVSLELEISDGDHTQATCDTHHEIIDACGIIGEISSILGHLHRSVHVAMILRGAAREGQNPIEALRGLMVGSLPSPESKTRH